MKNNASRLTAAVILAILCLFSYHWYQQDHYLKDLKPASYTQSLDFIALKIPTELGQSLSDYVFVWISNTNNEAQMLENTFQNNDVTFHREGIYYIIDHFESFMFKGINIENHEGEIFLNQKNLNRVGHATISAKGELTMGAVYPTPN